MQLTTIVPWSLIPRAIYSSRSMALESIPWLKKFSKMNRTVLLGVILHTCIWGATLLRDISVAQRFDLTGNRMARCIIYPGSGTSGTEKTKQWLNISKIDGITKLGMVGTISKVYGQTSRFPPDQIAGATGLSHSLSLQVLFTLFVASLIVSCA